MVIDKTKEGLFKSTLLVENNKHSFCQHGMVIDKTSEGLFKSTLLVANNKHTVFVNMVW